MNLWIIFFCFWCYHNTIRIMAIKPTLFLPCKKLACHHLTGIPSVAPVLEKLRCCSSRDFRPWSSVARPGRSIGMRSRIFSPGCSRASELFLLELLEAHLQKKCWTKNNNTGHGRNESDRRMPFKYRAIICLVFKNRPEIRNGRFTI